MITNYCEQENEIVRLFIFCSQKVMALIDLLMQVSEASVSRNRSTIIVPAGSSRDEGWAAFRNILAEINEAARLFILPNQVSLFSMHKLLSLFAL
jgi:hypothetical protein